MTIKFRIFSACAAMFLAFWSLHSSAAGSANERVILNAAGEKVQYFAEGSGPLVVILPSAGRGAEDYEDLAPVIARQGFRVIRPQPRGIGASNGKLQGVSLHEYAADVDAAIKAEKGGPAVIVGHAFGNWVARVLAVDNPKAVRGIALVAAAAKKFPQELYQALDDSANSSLPKERRLKALQLAFFAPGHDPAVWLDGWHLDAKNAQVEASKRTPVSEWWAAGTVPLLEVQAELDPFKTPEQHDELTKEFGSRVSVVVIRNASHALVPEQPVEVAQALVKWIRSLK